MRSAVVSSLLFVCLAGGVAAGQQKSPDQCGNCDCVHWPWAQTCSKCCGVAKGKIDSLKDGRLSISKGGTTDEFKLAPDAKLQGTLEPGAQATVHYKIGVNENLATSVVINAQAKKTPHTENDKPQ
jgi:hypothetical protein